MSGELIVNDAQGDAPRVGGHQFQWDACGLWLTEYARASASGWHTITFDASQIFGLWGHTVRVVPRLAPTTPADASPLWDKPEATTEEIIAYRGWTYGMVVEKDGTIALRLKSRHNEFWWDGPVTTADQPPTAENANGLYAISGKAHHSENFEAYLEDAEVGGRIALSGVVVEGEKGFRAERATIQELWVNPDDIDPDDNADGVAKLLADRYQCDVGIAVPSFALLK